MINYSWITTRTSTSHSALSAVALFLYICRHKQTQMQNHSEQLGVYKFRLPPGESSSLHTPSSMIMYKPHRTLLCSHSGVIIQPAAARPSSSWLCVRLPTSISHQILHTPPTVSGLADWTLSFPFLLPNFNKGRREQKNSNILNS